MTAPRVAPLAAGHRARVEEILRATGAFSDDEVAVALELVDDATSDAPSGDYECAGTFDATGALGGYSCWGPTPGTVGTFDLYWIATDPALHGGGHGRALLDAIERTLGDRGGRLLVAETSSRADYAATRAFYQKTGFHDAAHVADFYGPGDGRVLFTRRVGTSSSGIDAGHRAADSTTSSTSTRAPDGRGVAAR